MHNLAKLVLDQKLSEAQKLNNKYLSMMESLFFEASPSPVKYVMHKLKLCENVVRLPLSKATQACEKLLDNEMSELV